MLSFEVYKAICVCGDFLSFETPYGCTVMPLGIKVSIILPWELASHFFFFFLQCHHSIHVSSALFHFMLNSFSLYFFQLFYYIFLHISNLALKSDLFLSDQWTGQVPCIRHNLYTSLHSARIFSRWCSFLSVSFPVQAFHMLSSHIKIVF